MKLKRGIDEIKNHKWLENIDWISIEYKNIDTNDFGILNALKINENINKNIIDLNFKNKMERYSSILNKINKENYFKNFYFNFNDNKNKERNKIYLNEDFEDNINEDEE